MKRRLEKGQCFRQPCLGMREFAVNRIELVEDFDYDAIAPSLRESLTWVICCIGCSLRMVESQSMETGKILDFRILQMLFFTTRI